MATESTDDGADTIIQACWDESGPNLLSLVEFNIVGQQWALERLSHFYPAMGRVANCHRIALMAFKTVAKEIHEQEQTKEHDEKAPSAKKMPRPVGKGGSGSGMDGPDGDDGKGRDAKGKGGSDGKGAAAKSKDRDGKAGKGDGDSDDSSPNAKRRKT